MARADGAHIDDVVPRVHPCDEAVLVAADVEHDATIAQNVGAIFPRLGETGTTQAEMDLLDGRRS
jgi:hypothetical protein